MQQERRDIIRVEDLTVTYNGEVILDHVSFTVAAGEVFVILGGSGSGKSTLLKHMIGLYKLVAGHIFIDGEDIIAAEGEDRLAILRKIGVMYQSSALFGSMTVLENVSLPLEEFTALPAEAIRVIALIKLKQVGLEGFGNYMPSELSGGMQKQLHAQWRLTLECCFSMSPQPV
jgi:phospholipid/cholesterol/gamma-HCH transport system ATP-binding protein